MSCVTEESLTSTCNGQKSSSCHPTTQNGVYHPSTPVTSSLSQIILKSGVEQKIRIKDAAKVENLIEKLISSGPDELQIITDFDATLSCFHANGKRCTTSYGAIGGSRLVPAEVRNRGMELYNQYHPYENDATISDGERAGKLCEWYEQKHENYIQGKMQIPEKDLAEVIKDAHLVLREDSQAVLKKLNAHDIPTLVFSAGSGDTVTEILRLNQVDLPNTKVIANFMEFDEKTRELVGFSKPTIHPGNKNGTVLRDEPYFESLKTRHNAILLGDNIGDAEMATGMPNQNAILKIGFLNFEIEKCLETFKDKFDVVLIDDQTFRFVDALLDLIISRKL